MHISTESLLVILLIGAVAGWLAGQIVQGTGFGLLGDIIIGIVGAFIASWLFPQLGLHLGAGIVAEINCCNHWRRAAARDHEARPARRALVAALKGDKGQIKLGALY